MRRWSGLLVGVAAGALACGCNGQVGRDRAGLECRSSGDCGGGDAGTDAVVPRSDAGSTGGPPDASSLGAFLPAPLSDACFAPIGSGAALVPPAPEGESSKWQLLGAAVAKGGDGFALRLGDGSDAGVEARREVVVYVPRAGGCAIPVAYFGGPMSCGAGTAAGPGVVAAIVRCGYKNFSSSSVQVNGKPLSLDGLKPAIDPMDLWTTALAATARGEVLVAVGPSSEHSLVGVPGVGEPSVVDTLAEAWVAPAGVMSGLTTRRADSVLVTVDTVRTTGFEGAAVLLRRASDAGLGAFRIELQARDFSTVTTWEAPADVTLTGLAARGDGIAVTGEVDTGGVTRTWVAVLAVPELTLRWKALAPDGTGSSFGVGLTSGGAAVVGTRTEAGGIEVRAFTPDGATSALIASFAPPDGGALGSSATLGVAPDDAILLAADSRVAVLAAP